jgi:hypothetical protein
MHKPYSDSPKQFGALITPILIWKRLPIELQLLIFNWIHAIGDSANTVILKVYKRSFGGKDRRWKIEHAQWYKRLILIILN